MPRAIARNIAYWGIPPLLALLIFRPGFGAWFQADDFVWLRLVSGVHSWSDLSYALFHPTIHGTWRPFAERSFFVVLYSLFGYNALPYRIVGFLLQFADMALLSAVGWKITRSRLVGFLAPILWMSSDKLALTMVWNSNINYVICGLFLLLAMLFLLRHVETNRTRDLVVMWLAFLFGLGALEMMVVFPVMAAAYTWICARPYFKKTIPLLAASAIFATLHLVFAPNRAGSLYRMHFDAAIFRTLAHYWNAAFVPDNLSIFTRFSDSAGEAAMIAFSVALLGYAVFQVVRRNFLPALFLAWFLILLFPVIPLRDHFSSNYLDLPLIGLALLAADALRAAWRSSLAWRAIAAILLIFFLLESPIVARKATKAWAARSWAMHGMVADALAARKEHPDSDILLRNIDDLLFWGAIYDSSFPAFGLDNIYLAPGSESAITAHPEIGEIGPFVMPASTAEDRLKEGKLAVYAWNAKRSRLEEVTGQYNPPPPAAETPGARHGDRVDVGDPRNSGRLGQGWYDIGAGGRWTAKRASVRMTTGSEAHELRISGYCPAAALRGGALQMIVSANGRAFPAVTIRQPDAPFEFPFPLSAELRGEVEITVEVNRTFRSPPDERDLGLLFGVFEIR